MRSPFSLYALLIVAALGSHPPMVAAQDIEPLADVAVQAAAWGTNAFNGMINIITKKSEDVCGFRIDGYLQRYEDHIGVTLVPDSLALGRAFYTFENVDGARAYGFEAELAMEQERVPDNVGASMWYALNAFTGQRVRGVSLDVPLATQFGLLTEAMPQARRIGMLYNSHAHASLEVFNQARSAMPRGVELEAVDVARFGSRADAIDHLLNRRAAPWFEIVVNLPVAQRLSFTLPRTLVDGAHHVITSETEVRR
jgi:hypothetical protein